MSIKINERNNTLEITKAFQKKATFFGSVEYEELSRAKAAFPNYRVVVRKAKRSDTYKGLTVDFMRKYIISINDVEALEELDVMSGKSKNMEDEFKSVHYGEIRKWFLDRYPMFRVENNVKEKNNIRKIEAA